MLSDRSVALALWKRRRSCKATLALRTRGRLAAGHGTAINDHLVRDLGVQLLDDALEEGLPTLISGRCHGGPDHTIHYQLDEEPVLYDGTSSPSPGG